jgi:apurinic endonuclease (APN1)
MLIIGSHVTFNKSTQMLGSVEESLSYGANAFMFYTGAPQNTMRSSIDNRLTSEALELMDSNNIDLNNVIVHAPYIVNLANRTDERKYRFSIDFLKQELKRCSELNIHYIVLHPGSHVNMGIDTAIENIINALNEVLSSNDEVTILLETMAGKGTEVGRTIQELKQIIAGINNKSKIGICLDTCHLNDTGYDITNFDSILDEIDKELGLNYIKCIHINDSKNPIDSHKDRHENIGYGTIGFDTLINIIYNKRLESVPKILETPWINDMPFYKEEIEMIRNKQFKDIK